MKYPQQYDGDRVRPVMRGYRMRCCDCSLIHVLDFYIVRHKGRLVVEFRVRKHNRATAAARRKKKALRRK